MGELILFLIFLIPAMLGLAEIIHIFKTRIRYSEASNSYMLVYLCGENPVEKLNYALEQYFWLGRRYVGNIIAVATDLSEENYNTCRNIALKHEIIFCNENELAEILTELKK